MSDKKARMARKGIRILDQILEMGILALLLLLIAFGCYALWDARQVHNAGTAEKYEVFKPRENNSASLKELQEINPDVIGWITIYGTSIDYPILQGNDNQKYINTAADGTFSLAGAIFLDTACEPDFSSYHSMLHGHDMTDNAMFGQLHEFGDETFFEEHVYGNLYVDGKNYGIVLYEYLQADAYDSRIYRFYFENQKEKKQWQNRLKKNAIQYRQAGQRSAEHILSMNTCASSFTNARDLVLGYITEETYPDPFNSTRSSPLFRVDHLESWLHMNHLPLWVWMLLLLSVVTLLWILIHRHIDRSRIRRAMAAQVETDVQAEMDVQAEKAAQEENHG